MNVRIIGMFGKALKGNDVDYFDILSVATQAGYIVHPDCATKDVLKFLNEQKFNPNSTFYKTWQDVVGRNAFQLFTDRVKHYMTTYGTVDVDATTGIWSFNVPTEGAYTENKDSTVVELKSFKHIFPATANEIFEDCNKMLKSGIALNNKTIGAMVAFIKEEGLLDKVDIDAIKNKEAQVQIASALDKMPNDEFALLRTLVYKYTGQSMLIKSPELFNRIKNKYMCTSSVDLGSLSEQQLVSLSKVFYRFKPLFLAMKQNPHTNAQYVNKIRNLARKNHKPFKKGFWENCLSLQECDNDLLNYAKEQVNKLTNFKKIQLMQSIKSRIIGKDEKAHLYIVRNGKQFIRENYSVKADTDYLEKLYAILRESVVEFLKRKATTYNIANGVHITAPTSEKNFVGNYPMGTSVDMTSDNNVIGIYWRNEWGTKDFDLHCSDINGRRFGWCYNYYNEDEEDASIIYSGDMTWADPEAAEMFYFSKEVPEGLITVNKYNGEEKSQLKLFVAVEDTKEKFTSNKRQYSNRDDEDDYYKNIMVDPNNIKFEAMLDFDGHGQLSLGYTHNNKVYLMSAQSGYGRVTRTGLNVSDVMHRANSVKAESYVDLEELLIDAGFTKSAAAEIDLVNPTKDVIIDLFSDN